jgi:hypothetical protein
MAKTIYKEKQQYKRWDVLIPLAAFILVLLYGFITHITGTAGKTSSLHPAWVLISIIGLILAFAYLLSLRLLVIITRRHLRFQYFPLHFQIQKVKLEEIANCEPIEIPVTAELSGWNVNFTSMQPNYSVNGRKGLSVELKNGDTFFIGSKDPDALKTAIQKAINKRMKHLEENKD